MGIDTVLDYALANWRQLLLVVAGLLAVLLLLRIHRRKSIKRIESALAESANTISAVRSKLISLVEKKNDEYYQSFADPVNMIIKQILKTTEAAASLENENVCGIVRVCNHRSLALTLKKVLYSLSECIMVDFDTVINTFNLKMKLTSKKKSLEMITSFFSPVLVHYQPFLAAMPEYEKKLIVTAIEYRNLAKPGFFRKVRYFFSSSEEQKDKARLSEIRQSWREYIDLWKKVKKANKKALENLKTLLMDYNMKLFVFTPCEALTKQVIKSKRPLGNVFVERAEEVA